MEVVSLKVGWRCLFMVHGAQYVMMTGTLLMVQWFAGNLDMVQVQFTVHELP